MKTMDRARVRYRQALAAELRCEGRSYDEIAHTVGYANKSGAWKAVQRALDARTVAAADELVRLLFADLEVLQEKSWTAAMNGSVAAADRCLRATELRIQLLEKFASELGVEEREDAADAADRFLASQGDPGYVSRDPSEVFENSSAYVFVSVSGRVRGRSLMVSKKDG